MNVDEVDEKEDRLSFLKTASANERADATMRIVRKYMNDFVVRPALHCDQDENVMQAWRDAASAGR